MVVGLRVVVGRLVVVLGLLVVVDTVVEFPSTNPLRGLKISFENEDSAAKRC